MENIKTLEEFLNGSPKTIEAMKAYMEYLKSSNALPTFAKYNS